MAEQPSPVSVLDAFYTEEAMSPMKKKSYRFKGTSIVCCICIFPITTLYFDKSTQS